MPLFYQWNYFILLIVILLYVVINLVVGACMYTHVT